MTRSSGDGGAPHGFEYASTARRSVAYIIDMLVLVAVYLVGLFLVPLTAGDPIPFRLVVSVLLGLLYFVGSWARSGATPGQKWLGLRVLDGERGVPLTVRQAMRRWVYLELVVLLLGEVTRFVVVTALGKEPIIAGVLPALVTYGYIAFLLYTTVRDSLHQGFHDHRAGSIVVTRISEGTQRPVRRTPLTPLIGGEPVTSWSTRDRKVHGGRRAKRNGPRSRYAHHTARNAALGQPSDDRRAASPSANAPAACE